uniref:MABP domain-containing protein n=1 Tax=Timema bartmani TaxID=61472 RepID=A0A7R9F236_9NEOP|nr:unnamed protein product [Timema bartmani]
MYLESGRKDGATSLRGEEWKNHLGGVVANAPVVLSQTTEDGEIEVSRTHDQDSDADLWREGSFFGRKWTRYICLSKTESIADYIVESVAIINDKEIPPDGFSVITRTIDSGEFSEYLPFDQTIHIRVRMILAATLAIDLTAGDSEIRFQTIAREQQRAWRKRQLCYRLSRRNLVVNAVTDIIVLNRSKKAPLGFSLAGQVSTITSRWEFPEQGTQVCVMSLVAGKSTE